MEPTFLDRQRFAFSYLRENAVNAHVAGDGLLVNLLSHTGLHRISLLLKSNRFLLSLTDIAWMLIFSRFWMVNPHERYVAKEIYKKIPKSEEDAAGLVKWIELHEFLIERPLSYDQNLFESIRQLSWPKFFEAPSPEAETIVTHLVELTWYRNTEGNDWTSIVENWLSHGPKWLHNILSAIKSRLAVQTRLTAPNKAAPLLPESAAPELRSHSEFAELWLLHLHGRPKKVCSRIETLVNKISPDSHNWRILADFAYFNNRIETQQDSTAVHLARRRKLSVETPLLIFHDKREQRIDESLRDLFRAHKENMASQRWEICILAMLHEISALRLWDYGMWTEAIKAQAGPLLESSQWPGNQPELSAAGLILAVRGLCSKDPEKDDLTRKAISSIEFSSLEIRQHLASSLLATYPKQKHQAAELLGDLTDLLPITNWPELAHWTVSYSKESKEERTNGWSLAPATHWLWALTELPPDSEVWSTLQTEAVDIAKEPHCWHGGDTRRFLDRWLRLAPSLLAKELAETLLSFPTEDKTNCLKRTELLIDMEEDRSEFFGVFTRRIFPNTRTSTEHLILARHLKEPDLDSIEISAKQRISKLVREMITRATPDLEVKNFEVNFAYGVHLIESWTEDDSPLLDELIAAINSPKLIEQYVYWLIQTVQLLVAKGPPEFATKIQPYVSQWTREIPTGRNISGTGNHPFSVVHTISTGNEDIALMIGWLAFQLPRQLGPAAHEDILFWVKQMLLAGGIKPLEMAIYGSAVVALEAPPDKSADPLALFETALISMLSKASYSPDAVSGLASAIRMLGSLLNDKRADTSDLVPSSSFSIILSRFLPQILPSPHAELRAAIARFLWKLKDRGANESWVVDSLALLRKDNRARVRFEAAGGWAERNRHT